MTNPKFPIIGITLGDPGGIGPEVTVKALARILRAGKRPRAGIVLIGSLDIYATWNRRMKAGLTLKPIEKLERRLIKPGIPYVFEPAHWRELLPPFLLRYCRHSRFSRNRDGSKNRDGSSMDPRTVPVLFDAPAYSVGRISKNNAVLAYASLAIGTSAAVRGYLQGLVTAPVNKEAMRLIDPQFTGHTEYLARASKTREFAMMFEGGPLRVTLASIHLPLRAVSSCLRTRDIAMKIRLTDQFLRRFYGFRKPRIAVCALNPHGREFGREEDEKIVPAIRMCRKQAIDASGPYPGDQIFFEACRGRYEAVVAMYHDQGLAPLKTVAFDRAVNITLGLPFVRTSPDHGTAFGIAAQGKASPESMLAAILKAGELARR